MKKHSCILILAILFSACETEEKKIEFTNYTVERSYEDCNPEEGDCSFINLNFPVAVSENAAAENINRQINSHIIDIVDYQDDIKFESPEELADRFIENYEKSVADFPEYETAWEAAVYGEVLLKNKEIISVQIDSEVFTGGAHGYSSTSFLNFDPETGRLLNHKDLFTPEFKAFVEKQFRADQNIPADKSLNSTGMFFENDQFHLPQNIGFTQNQVILNYNAYEIASYAEGNFSMEFPLEETRKYTKLNVNSSSKK